MGSHEGGTVYTRARMPAPPPESSTLIRMRRRNYFVLATLLFGAFIAHALVAHTVRAAIALVLLGWSGCALGIGLAVGWGWLPPHRVGSLSGPLSVVFATALIHLTGGPCSPYFPLLGAFPLARPLLVPDTHTPAHLVSGGTLGVVILLDVLAGFPAREMLQHVVCFVLLALIASYGKRTYQRMRAAEQAAQAQRLEALEQLAESERRRAQAERERSEVERLSLVGQLAAEVAHEVNNPLAFVKSNLFFLEEEFQREDGAHDWEELRQVLDETRQGVLRIQQIVKDLRGFSREGIGDEARGWPQRALEEATRMVTVRLRYLGELSLDIAPALPSVRLGQRRLVQVLASLLLNAADAVERAAPMRRALIHVKVRRLEDTVRWELEDNGPGIPGEVLSRLFEPGFTTRPAGHGLGLGLALCREYVSQAGGSLEAENRAEGGARFVLLLPAEVETAPAEEPAPHPER